MSSINSLAKDLYNIINDKEKKGPKPSEPIAEVVKVDDDTVWVRLPGSVGETPVEKTMDANVGDKVRVRLSGGRAWVIGNMTVPPTGDTVAKQAMLIAKGASDHARKAIEKIEEMGEFTPGEFGIVGIWYEYNMSTSNTEFIQAQGYDWSEEIPEFDSDYFIWKRTVYEYADGEVVYGDPEFSSQDQALAEVKLAQDSTNNHFWHDESGAYVTEDDEDYTTGYATRTTAAGILQTYNNKLMASWTNSGMIFYQSDGETPYVTYGPNGITNNPTTPFMIGNNDTYMKWIREGGQWKLKIQADAIEIAGNPVATDADIISIDSIEYAYILSTSGTNPPSASAAWSSTPVAPTATQYAWTRTTVTYSDGQQAISYSVGGKAGSDGDPGSSITITGTSVMYATNGSGTSYPSSGWGYSVPSVAEGNYLWTRTIVNYSDGHSTTSYSTARQGADAEDLTSNYVTYNSTDGVTVGYTSVLNSKVNIKGDGVRIYNGAGNVGTYLHSSGMTVYDGSGSASSNVVAEFGSTARIGKTSTYNLRMNASSFDFYKASTKMGAISSSSTGGNNTIKIQSGTTTTSYVRLEDAEAAIGAGDIELHISTNSGESYINTDFGFGSDIEVSGTADIGKAVYINGGKIQSTYTVSNPLTQQASANLRITDNGWINKIAGSSKRYKTDISDAENKIFKPHNLYDLRIRQYRYKDGYFSKEDAKADPNAYNLRVGFIAEEIYDLYPNAVTVESGRVENWSERDMIPPMLALIQEQHQQIEELTKRIEALERKQNE